MTIGRVMDWTEARLDAIKAREEEEDEDEEKEKGDKDKDKDRERGPAAASSQTRRSTQAGTVPSSVSKAEGKKTGLSSSRTRDMVSLALCWLSPSTSDID